MYENPRDPRVQARNAREKAQEIRNGQKNHRKGFKGLIHKILDKTGTEGAGCIIIGVIWAAVITFNLALIGFGIWVVIQVLQHFGVI